MIRKIERCHGSGITSYLGASEILAVEQIQAAFLAGREQELPVRRAAGLVRQKEGAARAQVEIEQIEIRGVERSKEIGDGKLLAQFDHALPVIAAVGVRVEVTIGGNQVDVAVRIRRWPCASVPEGAAVSIWRVIKHGGQFKCSSIMRQDPAMVRAQIAVPRPG